MVAVLLLAGTARAQTDSGSAVRGTVHDAAGAPVDGVNVFLLETLEGALTGADGHFAFRTAHRGPATVIARRIGFGEVRRTVTLPLAAPLELALASAAIVLPVITAQAGRYTGGAEASATLSALEVVTTPGAAADIYRAIQTFPGLQQVDEGAGLFVRGGDVAETKILVNDAVVLSPYRSESPTGGTFGAFDAFQVEGISFSSGGFGARYGDALSGVLAMQTLGRPRARSGGATVSLAAVSANVALPLPDGFGVRVTGTRSSTRLLFALNGSTRDFTHVPEGRDLSGSATWHYRPNGEVRIYGLHQHNTLGVTVDQPSFTGSFESDEAHDFAVATLRDALGPVSLNGSFGAAGTTRTQDLGAFRLAVDDRQRQANLRLGWTPAGRLALTAGGEVEHRESGFSGRKALDPFDQRPGAPSITFGSTTPGTRTAAFAEADWQAPGRLRLTAGARTDHSTLTHVSTVDPRLAAALAVGGFTFTAAWGVYHQVPSPAFFEPTVGDTTLGPERARHVVLGAQTGSPDRSFFRIELYDKRYRDLAQQDRARNVVAGGTGFARGADLFVKLVGNGWGTRLAYSYVDTRRTDPDAGALARSPFDVTHTLTALAEKTWRNRWRLSVGAHYASGRPFTPVASASYDSAQTVWVPAYGAPMSERTPAFARMDVSASWLHQFWPRSVTIVFVSVNNAFDRANVFSVRYNADYTERIPLRSQFNRSFYFGVSTTWM